MPQVRKTASELLSPHFSSGDQVLCVGGFTRPCFDPSLFWLGLNGALVHVVDAQSPTYSKLMAKRAGYRPLSKGEAKFRDMLGSIAGRMAVKPEELVYRSMGSGDPALHAGALAEIARSGIPTRKPVVHIGDMTRPTRFPDGKFKLVLDAGSLYWVINSAKPSERLGLVPKVIGEYRRVGRSVVLFFLKDDRFTQVKGGSVNLYDVVKAHLGARGIPFEEHALNPRYSVKLNASQRRLLAGEHGFPADHLKGGFVRHNYGYDVALVIPGKPHRGPHPASS